MTGLDLTLVNEKRGARNKEWGWLDWGGGGGGGSGTERMSNERPSHRRRVDALVGANKYEGTQRAGAFLCRHPTTMAEGRRWHGGQRMDFTVWGSNSSEFRISEGNARFWPDTTLRVHYNTRRLLYDQCSFASLMTFLYFLSCEILTDLLPLACSLGLREAGDVQEARRTEFCMIRSAGRKD